MENCESLKTGQDAFEQVDVWNTRLEQEILTILALPLTMEAAIKKGRSSGRMAPRGFGARCLSPWFLLVALQLC